MGQTIQCISEKRVLNNKEFLEIDYNSRSKLIKLSHGLNDLKTPVTKTLLVRKSNCYRSGGWCSFLKSID